MTLAWVKGGQATPIAGVKGLLTSVRLSPDGRRVAFSSNEGDADVHVYDLTRQALKRSPLLPCSKESGLDARRHPNRLCLRARSGRADVLEALG